MDVYIFLCFIFALSALVERILPSNIRKILFLLNGLILLVIVAGRSCGTDYWLYKNIIEYGHIEEAMWPPLFAFLTKLFPFQIVIALVAIFTIIPFYILMYRFAGNLYNLAASFFFTEYFFMTLMQQSRQGIVLACIAWVILSLHTKKNRAILLLFISSLVHITGYLGLLPLFLKDKFLRLKTYVITYISSYILGGFVLKFLLTNVSALGITLLTSKMYGYANRTAELDASIPLFNFRFLLFFILLYYCYSKRNMISNNVLPYICNILFFGICFYTLFNSIVDLAVRGSSCFIRLYFFIILFLLQEKRIYKKHKDIIYWLSICYCLYLMIQYMTMVKNQNLELNLIPYSFM